MNATGFKEDHFNQIPALQLLQRLGYIFTGGVSEKK